MKSGKQDGQTSPYLDHCPGSVLVGMARAFHAGKARAFERGNVVVEIVDVLVIGSGISGLCSAALLAHRGYKTLVVPSHFEPTLAPEGKQLLQAELFVAREEYKKRPKQEWVRQLTDMVEDVFPGVKAEIEMIRSHVVSPSCITIWALSQDPTGVSRHIDSISAGTVPGCY